MYLQLIELIVIKSKRFLKSPALKNVRYPECDSLVQLTSKYSVKNSLDRSFDIKIANSPDYLELK